MTTPTTKTTIDPGDRVTVYLDSEGMYMIEGEVLSRPQATGDAWVIRGDGHLYNVQVYSWMDLKL